MKTSLSRKSEGRGLHQGYEDISSKKIEGERSSSVISTDP